MDPRGVETRLSNVEKQLQQIPEILKKHTESVKDYIDNSIRTVVNKQLVDAVVDRLIEMRLGAKDKNGLTLVDTIILSPDNKKKVDEAIKQNVLQVIDEIVDVIMSDESFQENVSKKLQPFIKNNLTGIAADIVNDFQ